MAKSEEELHRLELEAIARFGDLCRFFLCDDITNLDVLKALLELTEQFPHLQEDGSMEEILSWIYPILQAEPFHQVTRGREKSFERAHSPNHVNTINRSPPRQTFSWKASNDNKYEAPLDLACMICLEKLHIGDLVTGMCLRDDVMVIQKKRKMAGPKTWETTKRFQIALTIMIQMSYKLKVT